MATSRPIDATSGERPLVAWWSGVLVVAGILILGLLVMAMPSQAPVTETLNVVSVVPLWL